MAQRISPLEYNNQKTEYTKKALAELNKQLGTLKRNVHSIIDNQMSEEEEDDEENCPINYGLAHRKKFKKTEASKVHMEELLKKEETKSHYLILDLSNAKTELETEREKNKNLENICTEWATTIRLRLMAYLFVVNVIFGFMWFLMSPMEKILFVAPFSASIVQSIDFYNFFRKIKNYLKTK